MTACSELSPHLLSIEGTLPVRMGLVKETLSENVYLEIEKFTRYFARRLGVASRRETPGRVKGRSFGDGALLGAFEVEAFPNNS